MRILAVVVTLLTACAAQPVVQRPPVVMSTARMIPSEAEITERATAVFAAYDAHDAAAFRALIDPAFVLFESGRTYPGEVVVKQLAKKASGGVPAQTRTCEAPRFQRTSRITVYIAPCTEYVPAFAVGDVPEPASELEGWNTLIWVDDGAGGKLVHWQWSVGGVEGERQMWNTMFRTATAQFKRTANQHLIDSVKGVKPGTALDVAMGQGRNALYLAAQGWKVTGIDISDEGLRLAKEAAAKQRLALETINADADTYDYGKDRYDLVTMIYAGSDPKLIARLQPAVKRGGLFVVEYFHGDATAGIGIGGFGDGELAKQFVGWEILSDAVVSDIADWGLRKTKLVRFTARKR